VSRRKASRPAPADTGRGPRSSEHAGEPLRDQANSDPSVAQLADAKSTEDGIGRVPHPFAEIFPLMHGGEFADLVKDIAKHGLREPIVLYQSMILDGRNRHNACIEAGVTPHFKVLVGDDVAARAFVVSTNLHRRHLTGEQKRDLIAKLLKADPEKSDRQIAAEIGASPTTVGTVRESLEESGDVSKLDTSTDTKGRKQPRQRKTPKPAPARPAEEASGDVETASTSTDSRGREQPRQRKTSKPAPARPAEAAGPAETPTTASSYKTDDVAAESAGRPKLPHEIKDLTDQVVELTERNVRLERRLAERPCREVSLTEALKTAHEYLLDPVHWQWMDSAQQEQRVTAASALAIINELLTPADGSMPLYLVRPPLKAVH
jgi:ParB-like chromosome segregation protein Spo0J